jgi:hypothetical protein
MMQHMERNLLRPSAGAVLEPPSAHDSRFENFKVQFEGISSRYLDKLKIVLHSIIPEGDMHDQSFWNDLLDDADTINLLSEELSFETSRRTDFNFVSLLLQQLCLEAGCRLPLTQLEPYFKELLSTPCSRNQDEIAAGFDYSKVDTLFDSIHRTSSIKQKRNSIDE